MVSLEAQPLVQRITLERAASAGEGESQSLETVSCSLAVDLVVNGAVLSTVTLSPFHDAEDIQELVNSAIADLTEVGGRVAVKRRGSESEGDWFWSPNTPVQFDVIHLTPLGVAASDVVTVGVCSTGECTSYCVIQDSNVDLTVGIETIQEASSPMSFQMAFNTSSQQQRDTETLPLDATNDMLRSALTGLLSWDCTEEEGIAEKTILYEQYEEPGRDNSTSFCGAYSEHNPYIFYQDSDYRLDNVPYVSASCIKPLRNWNGNVS